MFCVKTNRLLEWTFLAYECFHIEISDIVWSFASFVWDDTVSPPKYQPPCHLTAASKGPRLFGDEGGELDMGKLALFRTIRWSGEWGMEIKGDRKVMVPKGHFLFCFFLFYGWHPLQAIWSYSTFFRDFGQMICRLEFGNRYGYIVIYTVRTQCRCRCCHRHNHHSSHDYLHDDCSPNLLPGATRFRWAFATMACFLPPCTSWEWNLQFDPGMFLP